MKPCKPNFINDHWLIGRFSSLVYRWTRLFGCPLNLFVVRLSLALQVYPSPQSTELGVLFLCMRLIWSYCGRWYMWRSRSYFSISEIWSARLSDGRRCRCCHPVFCLLKSPKITTCWVNDRKCYPLMECMFRHRGSLSGLPLAGSFC